MDVDETWKVLVKVVKVWTCLAWWKVSWWVVSLLVEEDTVDGATAASALDPVKVPKVDSCHQPVREFATTTTTTTTTIVTLFYSQ